ncbi:MULTISPECIES: FAD-binding oxidoreductase [Halomonadaceae]|uniref:NAD(P)/FAD-dependent oxidoreductase n=1 Tax=Halomonadaceae TaxID=28256 RepID=UPI0015993D63|nr:MULTISPECIES: FAD-binding oxidoreductase [Halomonas]QJQ95419.1 FAD-binding oxidoreductase [Halomonas sp. PA5]
MAREILVLGAGMVGTSIAFHLARRGHSVTLVDRRPPGEETSFGNAGIIQREAVQPHAFPRDMTTLLQVLPNRRIDIRYHPRGMLAAAGPLFQYWRHSAPGRYADIVPEYASLIMRCTDEHQQMIEAAGAEALVRREGWLEVFRTQRVFDAVLDEAKRNQQRFGVSYEMLDRAALKAKEPHLADALLGAIHWTNSWTVIDPGALVQAYARAFEAEGGRFEQAEVTSVEQAGSGWRLTTPSGTLEAQSLVLATGPWAHDALKPLGYRLPMFPKRGYHMHYTMREPARLSHWVMDYESGYLLAPMRAGIRLTTGAELTTLEGEARHGQLEAAERVARQLLPLGERRDPEPWRGNRPCMPDMKPVIGPAPRHPGLWFAFGHGHQGFTLGPVTGRLIGEMIDGESPCVDVAPFRAERF